MCNTGVGLTPRINDRLHHFSAGGLYNGLVLLIDDETRTYWDHITGEALHGPLRGERMPMWGIQLTSVEAAIRENPGLRVLQSRARLIPRVMEWVMSLGPFKNRFPPFFRRTMARTDPRLPEMEMGLGVVEGSARRFYPLASIGDGVYDDFAGRPLHVEIDRDDKVPHATRPDAARPVQLFCRWYGFSFSFPGCEIFGENAPGS